ncbi:MAG: hypothetical protein HYY30_00035 [Chloroflexi bacterium]|nr:hypothetical protein [Chloroflexota bacterium]
MDERRAVNVPDEEGSLPATKQRKPYVKPEIVYRAPLEAMASSCITFPGKEPGLCGVPYS